MQLSTSHSTYRVQWNGLAALVLLHRGGHEVIKVRVQHGLKRHHAVLDLVVAGFQPMKWLGCVRIIVVASAPSFIKRVVGHALKRKQLGVESLNQLRVERV